MAIVQIKLLEGLDAEGIKRKLSYKDPDDMTGLLDQVVALLDLPTHGIRAQLEDVSVLDVTLENQTVHIEYEYYWSAHYGCRDMNDAGAEISSVTATYIDDVLTFEVPDGRTTDEEF